MKKPRVKFSEVLSWSFAARSSGTFPGWCPGCRSYSQHRRHRAVVDLPPVLILDAAMKRGGPGVRQSWTSPSWLPEEIGLLVDNQRHVTCFEGDKLRNFRSNSNLAIYELVGFVADINSTKGQKSHLVSFINGR